MILIGTFKKTFDLLVYKRIFFTFKVKVIISFFKDVQILGIGIVEKALEIEEHGKF